MESFSICLQEIGYSSFDHEVFRSAIDSLTAVQSSILCVKDFKYERTWTILFNKCFFLCRISVIDHPRNVFHYDVGRSSFFYSRSFYDIYIWSIQILVSFIVVHDMESSEDLVSYFHADGRWYLFSVILVMTWISPDGYLCRALARRIHLRPYP